MGPPDRGGESLIIALRHALISHNEIGVHMVRRCGTLVGMSVSSETRPRPVALVERRHVDLMRVAGSQCCRPERMR